MPNKIIDMDDIIHLDSVPIIWVVDQCNSHDFMQNYSNVNNKYEVRHQMRKVRHG